MKPWGRALKDAIIVGSFASLTSAAALALRGRSETGYALATLNAPSHWLWGDRALHKNGPSMEHTGAGFAIHHASSIFWAVIHEKTMDESNRDTTLATHLTRATVTAILAALVDLRIAPDRLTPGFERRLSASSLCLVYGLFGLGLGLGSYWLNRRRRKDLQGGR